MTSSETRAKLIAEQGYCPHPADVCFYDSVVNHEHSDSKGLIDATQVELLYPLNPVTNLRTTDIAKLLDNSLSLQQKEAIMRRLQKLPGGYAPSELSDDELMSLVPLRSMSGDPVDVQALRDYISTYVLPSMNAPVVEEVVNNSGEKTQNSNDNEEIA